MNLVLNGAALAFIVANAAAAALAWFAGWDRGELFRLFWIEIAFVGLIGVLQIVFARRPGPLAKSKGYQSIFFVAHYGTFCVAYGAMVAAILDDAWESPPEFFVFVLIPAMLLAAAHGIDFWLNYLPRGAALVSSMQAMLLPYARVVPLQVPLIVAAMVLPVGDGTDHGAVLVLAIAKLAGDVAALAARERRVSG